MRTILLCTCLVLASSHVPAQQTLDNEAVINLAKSGLSDDLLVTTINASPGRYDISPNGLSELKNAKLGDKVVAAIVLKANGGSRGDGRASAPGPGFGTAPASVATSTSALPVGINDVGVYYRDADGRWVPMLPEIVVFESTGKLKSLATAGMLKGDLNGRIEGSRSTVRASLPLVFAVYLPETVEISEYVLLRLHPTGETRTFLSAAGGFLHTQAGAPRDEVEFQPEKLAPRLYQITLPAVEGNGEYGLLAPGNQIDADKETTAKIYTVSVVE